MTGYNELRGGQEFYASGYKKGYEDAKKEYARPQGKWTNRETGGTLYPFWERYECNQCHKFNYCFNFCPNCGAEMKGGAE